MIQSLPQASAHTRRLSEYIAGAGSAAAGCRGREGAASRARYACRDGLGLALRPGHMAIGYAAWLGGVPDARLSVRLRTSAVNAALANGMLAHADETDDSHAPSRTHPGCAVIPAALAAAERAAPAANGSCAPSCSATTSPRG